MLIKIILSYDGSKFYGFQIQQKSTLPTVAGKLTKVLKKFNIETKITGSGRTDKGVHAFNQVAHFEIPDFWKDKLDTLHKALNKHLHPHIHIKSLSLEKNDFHARFSAKKRLYRYMLYTGEYKPFLSSYALHVNAINLQKLNEILKIYEGTHDFSYFKKEGNITSSNERTIYQAKAYEHKGTFVITFLGNAFLRSQVRMMVSFALKILEGKRSLEDLKAQLTCKEICSTALVSASGLYLSKIYY